MPRPKGSADLIEARRRQALRLVDKGYSLNEAARLIGCAASSVMRWFNARRQGGARALKVRFSPGRPAALSEAQRKRVVKYLLQGAMAHGFSTELWTTARVAQLIEKRCQVRFHRSHVARLLHELKFTCQKPQRRALERNETEIRRWKREEWPRIKKKPRGWAPTSSLSTNPGSC